MALTKVQLSPLVRTKETESGAVNLGTLSAGRTGFDSPRGQCFHKNWVRGYEDGNYYCLDCLKIWRVKTLGHVTIDVQYKLLPVIYDLDELYGESRFLEWLKEAGYPIPEQEYAEIEVKWPIYL